MDETPIKAGRVETSGVGPGKTKSGCFLPAYGELDEVSFPNFEPRRHEHVQQAPGLLQASGTVLLSDGHPAYAKYAHAAGITRAECWVQGRRGTSRRWTSSLKP